jgi:hypothetical protein
MVQGEQPAGLHIRQVYWSGPSIGGEYAHFTANAKHLQSLANFALIFENTTYESISPSIHLHLGDTFWADIRAHPLRNVSRHARAVLETYPLSLSKMCWR